MFGFIILLIILNVFFGVFIPWGGIISAVVTIGAIAMVLLFISYILFGEHP